MLNACQNKIIFNFLLFPFFFVVVVNFGQLQLPMKSVPPFLFEIMYHQVILKFICKLLELVCTIYIVIAPLFLSVLYYKNIMLIVTAHIITIHNSIIIFIFTAILCQAHTANYTLIFSNVLYLYLNMPNSFLYHVPVNNCVHCLITIHAFITHLSYIIIHIQRLYTLWWHKEIDLLMMST